MQQQLVCHLCVYMGEEGEGAMGERSDETNGAAVRPQMDLSLVVT